MDCQRHAKAFTLAGARLRHRDAGLSPPPHPRRHSRDGRGGSVRVPVATADAGDPAAILAGDNATPEQLDRIRTSLGLNEPIYIQFYTWVAKLLHGDLGVSLISNKPILEMIGPRLEPSISVALATIVLSILVAVPLGVIAAWKHGTWIDRCVMGLSVLGFSVPVFVIGYVLIQIFAIDLRWLPVQGFRSISAGFGPFFERLCCRRWRCPSSMSR